MSKEELEKKESKERRFSQEQYDMLKRCSDKKDMTEWNQWQVNNPEKDILLEGATLNEFYLEGALLNKGVVEWDNKVYNFTREVYLENANLGGAHLENAKLGGAHLENARLVYAHLENASFVRAYLENAYLVHAYLENAYLVGAHLENAYLWGTHLENAYLWDAHLENADLEDAHLENANFERATVDGKTLVWECKLDRMTNFQGVGLGSIRIDPQTKQLLEYNIRRTNWEKWYIEHPQLKWLVKPFWLMSDYGLSTSRIIFTFFGLALVFANIYYHWGRIAPPGIVRNLFVGENGVAVPWWLVPLRTLYFSIVTMTTLGFGDMYANAHSVWGHIMLSLQVILGYVLLGALVTRFAVLFTAGGPAGKFAEEKKETPE